MLLAERWVNLDLLVKYMESQRIIKSPQHSALANHECLQQITSRSVLRRTDRPTDSSGQTTDAANKDLIKPYLTKWIRGQITSPPEAPHASWSQQETFLEYLSGTI